MRWTRGEWRRNGSDNNSECQGTSKLSCHDIIICFISLAEDMMESSHHLLCFWLRIGSYSRIILLTMSLFTTFVRRIVDAALSIYRCKSAIDLLEQSNARVLTLPIWIHLLVMYDSCLSQHRTKHLRAATRIASPID